MLSPENIHSIIQSGEGYNAEFKVRLPRKLKDISVEICAFANAAGGVLLLGVADDNSIVGAQLDNAQRSSLQNSLNEINPHLECEIYAVSINEKEVWVIEVNSGIQKPYVLSGAIYIRQGSNTQKLTSVEQMRDFFQQSEKIYFDEVACAQFDVDYDIDESFFEEFRVMANLSPIVSQSQVIENLRLLLSDGQVKNGGVLFFGKTPEFFIEKAVIRCIAFEGNTKNQIIDDKIFGGALMHQYKNTMQWLKSKLNVSYIIDDAGPRKEVWEIPEVAFKESLINALAHRDYYDKGARITVELFEDRIEISNPGGLISAITHDNFGTKSHSRNPLIFGLFERINMVEQIGSGIGRIKNAFKQVNQPAPEFKLDGFFTVIFKRNIADGLGVKLGVKLGVNEQKIIDLIKKNPNSTIAEMAKAIGISTTAIENNLKKLKDKKIIHRQGSDKKGHFILTSQKELGVKLGVKLGVNEQKVLQFLSKTPGISILELSQEIGISTTAIENNLKKLKDKDLIKREGSAKTGHWIVI